MRLDRLAQLQTGADRNRRTHVWSLYCVFGIRRMQSQARWRCMDLGGCGNTVRLHGPPGPSPISRRDCANCLNHTMDRIFTKGCYNTWLPVWTCTLFGRQVV